MDTYLRASGVPLYCNYSEVYYDCPKTLLRSQASDVGRGPPKVSTIGEPTRAETEHGKVMTTLHCNFVSEQLLFCG